MNVKQNILERRTANVKSVPSVQLSPAAVKGKVTAQIYKGKYQRLGTVAIPDINICLPVYDQPYNSQALSRGAQQLKSVNASKIEVDNAMGSGNFILVAHNYNDGKSMFSPLQQYINKDAPYLVNGRPAEDHWIDGMNVFMANDKGVYKYKIISQKTISATDTSVRRDSEEPELNIITCLFPSDTYRIDTRAKLVKQWSWNNAPNSALKPFDNTYNLRK